MATMAVVQSVNVGVLRSLRAKTGVTGIDKVPVHGAVTVSVIGPNCPGRGGLAGDVICDAENHGGDTKAVYAYAREDLDQWAAELGAPLRSGMFGENLTTSGLDVTGALIGETWRLGESVVLQVTSPRVPCSTFAAFMGRKGWLKSFTRRAVPGAYLKVLAGGELEAGDPLVVEFKPSHNVSVGTAFRALTLEPELCKLVLEASEYLDEEIVQRARTRDVFVLYDEEEA
jgi:MOSC domain-containing protein YiiM